MLLFTGPSYLISWFINLISAKQKLHRFIALLNLAPGDYIPIGGIMKPKIYKHFKKKVFKHLNLINFITSQIITVKAEKDKIKLNIFIGAFMRVKEQICIIWVKF